MGKKQKSALELTDLQVSYDYFNGTIKLVSNDPLVQGKPFKLTVASNSPTYKTLFQLLEDQGLVDLGQVKLPTKLTSYDLLLDRLDNTAYIPLGQTFKEHPAALDLNTSSHVLIASNLGGGTSTLLRSIMLRALNQPQVSLHAVSLKENRLSGYAFRKQDRFATTYEAAVKLMRALDDELVTRYTAMASEEVRTFGELPKVPRRIYLVIDEIANFLDAAGEDKAGDQNQENQRNEFQFILDRVLRMGRAAGIHVFLGTLRPAGLMLPSELSAHVDTRIILGALSTQTAHPLLGQKPAFGPGMISPWGRGIMRIPGQAQMIFQSNSIPIPGLVSTPE
jgi:DNA segregation ATPase FtsK/SpoIIIE-like protein